MQDDTPDDAHNAPPSPAAAYLRAHILIEGEKIRYEGRPGLARAMRFNFWFCPVGLILLLFCFLIWWNSTDWGPVRLPEIVVLAGALWLASSPLRYALRAWNTAYFVTNERAIILEKGLIRVRETNFYPEDITDFQLKRRARGRGDLHLRLSRSRAKTAYQEDKERYLSKHTADGKGPAGFFGAFSGATPYTLFTDGFWDAAEIQAAADAIKAL
ncbi:MAG: hypothetical protein EP348_12600 [Alphaproteobacteria bacterium]|nr:MAG: hypothetical protein EP348_12600 [Alphaproteobacteria bacterium]